MKAYSKVTAVGAALLLVGALAGTALAIEAFSERFEEDFSQPRTILARVIVVDPYEDAVWVNWVWKGVRNSGEINQFWAMMLPGKNMRVFASGKDLEILKSKARPKPGPAAAEQVPPTTKGDVVEMTVQEVEQNRRVATNVKDVDDKLWSGVVAGGSDAVFPGQPNRSIWRTSSRIGCGAGREGSGVPRVKAAPSLSLAPSSLAMSWLVPLSSRFSTSSARATTSRGKPARRATWMP